MTHFEFEKRMLEIKKKGDRDAEMTHIEADDLLCEALKSLGYEKGIKVYDKIMKWYA